MFRFGIFRTRRRRGSAAGAIVVIPVVLAFIVYDDWTRSRQMKEAFQGTIVRVYKERPPWSRHGSASHLYWDVRTAGREDHAIRVYSRDLWNAGAHGMSVIKREGELDPDLLGRR
jgi:hypothetical protein